MDVISYAKAKNAQKRRISIDKVLGEKIEGAFTTVKERVGKLESSMRNRGSLSNQIILNADLGLLQLKRKQELAGIATTDAYDHILDFTFKDSSSINTKKSSLVSIDSIEKEVLIKEKGRAVLKIIPMKLGISQYYIEALFKELLDNKDMRIDVTYFQENVAMKNQLIDSHAVIRIGPHLTVNGIEISITNLGNETLRMSNLTLIWR